MEEKEIIFWGDYFARRDSIQDWINSECFIREREKPRNPYSLEPLPDEILSIFPPQLMQRDDSDNLYWKNKVLNCFRTIDDHGYYTDPSWIFETSHRQWQKFVHLLDKSIEEAEMHLPTYELILINQLYPFVDFFDMEPDYENAIGTIMLKLEELIRKQSEYEDRKLCCWWILDSLQHIVEGGIGGVTDMEEREEQSRELHFLEQYFGIPIRFMMHRGDMPFHL
jgi:hypothetical protein